MFSFVLYILPTYNYMATYVYIYYDNVALILKAVEKHEKVPHIHKIALPLQDWYTNAPWILIL